MFSPPPPPPLSVTSHHLNLPKSPPLPSISNFLFDPTSLSLALYHSDSSLSLYSSISSSPPTHLSSSPQYLIPFPTSSSTFLHLSTNPTTTVFLVSSHTHGGSAILLSFYLQDFKTKIFKKIKALCNHSDLGFDEGKLGLVFGVRHGVGLKLIGGVNVFVLYSVSNEKIWVFSVRMVGGEVVKLMKSAVIECCLPVFSISVEFGYLVLGEEKGVRVFALRRLVKGRVRREVKLSRKVLGVEKVKKLNGLINGINGIDISIREGGKSVDNERAGNGNESKVALEAKSSHSVSSKII